MSKLIRRLKEMGKIPWEPGELEAILAASRAKVPSPPPIEFSEFDKRALVKFLDYDLPKELPDTWLKAFIWHNKRPAFPKNIRPGIKEIILDDTFSASAILPCSKLLVNLVCSTKGMRAKHTFTMHVYDELNGRITPRPHAVITHKWEGHFTQERPQFLNFIYNELKNKIRQSL